MSKLISFAEVIESCLTHFRAQCWEYGQVPAYGSLVTVEQDELTFYALVHQSATTVADGSYAVQAYKKTEEELQREQPQIFELLKTTFIGLTVAHKLGENIKHTSAPVPTRMHAFVRYATDEECAFFTRDYGYLSVLFGHAPQVNVDELLLAFLIILQQKKLIIESDLIVLLRTYLLLCGNDYSRVRFLAQRIHGSC